MDGWKKVLKVNFFVVAIFIRITLTWTNQEKKKKYLGEMTSFSSSSSSINYIRKKYSHNYER